MRVLEATAENCMKALEKILSEQGVCELISRAAEIRIEIEGKAGVEGILEGQAVLLYLQDMIAEDTDLMFRVEHNEMHGEEVQLVLLVKEKKSVLRKGKMFKKKLCEK